MVWIKRGSKLNASIHFFVFRVGKQSDQLSEVLPPTVLRMMDCTINFHFWWKIIQTILKLHARHRPGGPWNLAPWFQRHAEAGDVWQDGCSEDEAVKMKPKSQGWAPRYWRCQYHWTPAEENCMYRVHVDSSQQELQEADLSKVVLRPLELRPSQHESQMLDKELE